MFERHRCDNCGRKFRKIEELMQHQCNASFEGMEQMRDHAKKFHTYHKRVSEEEEEKEE
jgi:predicted  nucleic acid-binding Zn-ribbon protein